MNGYCITCQKEIPFLSSYWEGINPHKKLYWLVQFCHRCGTVTDIDSSEFSFRNLLPRIGRVKSFLFVSLIIGTPYHLIAWGLGGVLIGSIFTPFILVLAFLVARTKVNVVDSCPYEPLKQYQELKKEV